LLWYKYVEQSGFATADFSVAGNNGQNVCGWTTGPGSSKAATNVSACGFMVDATSNSTWAATDFSYSMWVNPTGTPGTQYPLFLVQLITNAYMVLAINSTNQLEFMAHYPTSSLAGGVITPAAWQMVSFTYKASTGKMTLYINGAQVATTNLISAFTDGTIYIGGTGAFVGAGHLPGSIADTRIYSTELTAANVLAIYNAGAQ
jgi:hypothetical protein